MNSVLIYREKKRGGAQGDRETEAQTEIKKSQGDGKELECLKQGVGLAQTKHMHTYKYQVNYVKERKGENVSSQQAMLPNGHMTYEC